MEEDVRAALLIIVLLAAVPAQARNCAGMSDTQIREAIVKESRNTYYRTGHPCACPEDRASNGRNCGRRSAYSRPGGASPKCYPVDVKQSDIVAFCRLPDQHG
jgi:hypothetical protein